MSHLRFFNRNHFLLISFLFGTFIQGVDMGTASRWCAVCAPDDAPALPTRLDFFPTCWTIFDGVSEHFILSLNLIFFFKNFKSENFFQKIIRFASRNERAKIRAHAKQAGSSWLMRSHEVIQGQTTFKNQIKLIIYIAFHIGHGHHIPAN